MLYNFKVEYLKARYKYDKEDVCNLLQYKLLVCHNKFLCCEIMRKLYYLNRFLY